MRSDIDWIGKNDMNWDIGSGMRNAYTAGVTSGIQSGMRNDVWMILGIDNWFECV